MEMNGERRRRRALGGKCLAMPVLLHYDGEDPQRAETAMTASA